MGYDRPRESGTLFSEEPKNQKEDHLFIFFMYRSSTHLLMNTDHGLGARDREMYQTQPVPARHVNSLLRVTKSIIMGNDILRM